MLILTLMLLMTLFFSGERVYVERGQGVGTALAHADSLYIHLKFTYTIK